MNTENLKFYFLLIITTIFWGLSWPITKILVSLAPSFTIGFFRFLIASICYLPLLIIYYKPLEYTKRTYVSFFLGGLVGIFGYGILFLIGMKFTTAAQGSIITGLNPISISIWAHLLHKERLDRRWKYSGFLVSFIGVSFVIGIQALIEFRIEYLIGNIIIVFAMGCWGLYSNLGRKSMDEYSPFEVTAGSVLFGTIMFGLGAVGEQFWLQEALSSFEFWIGIFFLGIFVTFLSFSLYFISIENISATNTSVFINLVPLFGTFFSWLLLKEEIYWTFIIGLFLIISGIFIINYQVEECRDQRMIS